MKTLHNTDASGTSVNVPDVVIWGDGDVWQLICKASSENEEWMKSTKALEVAGVGCFVQVTTQQRNDDGTYAVAEAVTFAPNVRVNEIRADGNVLVGRTLVDFTQEEKACE